MTEAELRAEVEREVLNRVRSIVFGDKLNQNYGLETICALIRDRLNDRFEFLRARDEAQRQLWLVEFILEPLFKPETGAWLEMSDEEREAIPRTAVELAKAAAKELQERRRK